MNKTVITHIKKYTKELKVLFIEDDYDTRVQSVKMFENLFDNIITANDGLEGLEKFDSYDFDLILSDIQMPKLDGIEFIKKIRAKNNTIPIVMISAYDNTPYLLKSIEYGVDGYLIKPIEIESFLNIIQKVIDKIYAISSTDKNIIFLLGGFYWNGNIKKLSKEEDINLTANETKFLDFLITSKGVVRSYVDIDLYLFEEEQYNERRIRNLVSRLRKKIGYSFLESVYSEGYKINIQR